ncbi:MAG: DUF1501 domain-containing protein [Acidobacteria bacterium]|nr:DUF1501 domain-containing protein [Acidobacteriota bacterium]
MPPRKQPIDVRKLRHHVAHRFPFSQRISRFMGLDHTRLTYRYQDRDFRLTDVGGTMDLMHKLRA